MKQETPKKSEQEQIFLIIQMYYPNIRLDDIYLCKENNIIDTYLRNTEIENDTTKFKISPEYATIIIDDINNYLEDYSKFLKCIDEMYSCRFVNKLNQQYEVFTFMSNDATYVAHKFPREWQLYKFINIPYVTQND